ncbi:S8 family serine peptidase [Streptomyces phytohabitans]|uniref:S8 family serine peptidase n=1 Tax=Streptomyces phytohabitans TaxID=1150371 RepID=UPI00345BC4A4
MVSLQTREITAQRRDTGGFLPSLAIVGALTLGSVGLAPAAAADSGPDQWYLDAMQAEEMWKVSTGEGITVAVVDSGVRDDTAALNGKVLPGKDVSGEPGGVNDDPEGHGTSMAELIAGSGKNGGIKGLAPGAKIIPFRVQTLAPGEEVDWSKEETGGADKGILAAAKSPAQIINVSIASDIYDPASEEAIKYATKKGKLVFVGAGNDGDGKNARTYPATFDEAVAVAAVDKSAKAAKFSQHGDYIDLAAPGTDIPGWCRGQFDQYCQGLTGTSASTAFASASAALIWSKHKDWTGNQVLRVMLQTAGRADKNAHGSSKYIGYGTVRPSRVLLKGEGDPGDPDKFPLALKYPLESPSPTPSPAGESSEDEKGAAEKVNVAESSESGDDSNLGLIIGTGAAVAVLAGGAFAFMRMRRK